MNPPDAPATPGRHGNPPPTGMPEPHAEFAAVRSQISYDGQGYWLRQKRLSESRFRWWPESTGERGRALAVYALERLPWSGDPDKAAVQPVWRRVIPAG